MFTFLMSSISFSLSAASSAAQASSAGMSWIPNAWNMLVARLIVHSVAMWPSPLQSLQTVGGFSGHSAARCPTCSQTRQVPVNSRSTRSLVHSALL